MSRLLAAAVIALVALGAGASAATAHPLGNFTVNHLTEVRIGQDEVTLHYVLDQAEIPTFQERREPRAELLRRKQAEIRRGLGVVADGRPLRLRPASEPRLSFPAGEGGLTTTRLEVVLVAAVDDPRRIEVRDDTFAERLGWRAIVPRPGEGTEVRSSVPAEDPTDRLRSYPERVIDSPPDQRRATFAVTPGDGSVLAPEPSGAGETRLSGGGGSGDGFAAIFDDAASGKGVLLVLMLAALGWGAFHALSPGHGKAMVAAYLIGTRGTTKHAVALGAVVTVTHTIGVFALGLVTLLLSAYVLPEDLYPWLNLVAGLLVLVIGLGVLRSRLRWRGARRAAAHDDHDHAHHAHDHGDHAHDHGHHAHAHGHHGHGHEHGHGHRHVPDELSWKGLMGMGASAGLIPCPSALVVLLGAIAQQQVALGLLLIVTFSVGLAGTLTVLGILVVHARRFTARVSLSGPVTTALPALSALLIVGIGCLLTLRAVPQLW